MKAQRCGIIAYLCLCTAGACGQSKVLEANEEVGFREQETTFLTAEDVVRQADGLQRIADPVRRVDVYSLLQKKRYEWVNLGNHGTAARTLFLEAPQDMGAKSGFSVYKSYYQPAEQLRYYFFEDAFPFIEARVDLGQRRRSIVRVDYAKNVATRWNMGLHLNTTQRNHPLGASYQQSERHVQALSYRLHAVYLSNDGRYKMLAHITNISHKVGETGGSQANNVHALIPNYYFYRRSRVNLQDAFSAERQRNVYVLHNFRLTERKNLYVCAKNERETQQYKDSIGTDTERSYYRNTYFSDEKTNDITRFHTHHYALGLTERRANFWYELYVKERITNYRGNALTNEKRQALVEKYLGLKARAFWRKQGRFDAHLSIMHDTRHYYYVAAVRSEGFWVDMSYQYVKKNPDLLNRYYYGNHHRWERRFLPVHYQQAGVEMALVAQSRLQARLSAQWIGVNNLLYYNQQALPTQWHSAYLPWMARVRLGWTWRFWQGFCWENRGVYSYAHRRMATYVPMPTWFFYGRLWYERSFFREYLHLVLGVEAHGRSAYYGYAYQPAIRQFHLQNDLLLPGYVPLNLFLNADIETFTAYLKVIHLNQQRNNGYLISPYYPGEERFVDVGFVWRFFN